MSSLTALNLAVPRNNIEQANRLDVLERMRKVERPKEYVYFDKLYMEIEIARLKAQSVLLAK